jgi:hypothetical protein
VGVGKELSDDAGLGYGFVDGGGGVVERGDEAALFVLVAV